MWNNDVKLQRISNHSSTYVRTKCPLEPTKFHKYTLHIYASITAFYYCAAYAHNNNVWQYHIVSLKKICQIFRMRLSYHLEQIFLLMVELELHKGQRSNHRYWIIPLITFRLHFTAKIILGCRQKTPSSCSL